MMIGGASQLKGMDDLISKVIGVPARVADRPSYVNAVGAGSALNYINDSGIPCRIYIEIESIKKYGLGKPAVLFLYSKEALINS